MATQGENRKIDEEIAAYEIARRELEQKHHGKWVVFCDRKLVGIFDDFGQASRDAAIRFGRGPYMIRQVGANPLVLPASVAYRHENGSH